VSRPALSARLAAAIAREGDLAAGVRLFDAGAHWHAHEAWERAWRADRNPDRHFLKGLIQLAAACHHLSRGAPGPALRLLGSAHGHLANHQGPRWPFDQRALLIACERLQRQVAAGAGAGHEVPRLAALFRAAPGGSE
jgi:hypothetical protein